MAGASWLETSYEGAPVWQQVWQWGLLMVSCSCPLLLHFRVEATFPVMPDLFLEGPTFMASARRQRPFMRSVLIVGRSGGFGDKVLL